MKLRVPLSIALALFGVTSTALSQESGRSASGVQGAPWVTNQSLGDGSGVKTGKFEWHPGVSGEIGYDSNYYQRANSTVEETNFGPVVPAMRLRVTPQLSVRTEQLPDARPPVSLDATGSLAYNEIISLEGGRGEEFAGLRNLQGGLGAVLGIVPGRIWSGQVRGGYSYIAEPSNQGGLAAQFDRHTVNGGAGVLWAPGSGAFRWTLLDYSTRATFFDEAAFGAYDNGNHQLMTSGVWRFLPRTSVLFDGQVNIIRYGTVVLNDGETMQARLGLNGLLTKKIGLLVRGGYAASFYFNSNGVARNYGSFIGSAEAKYFFTPEGKMNGGSVDVGPSTLNLGVIRDFNDSYLGDYYRRHRIYSQLNYLIGGRLVTSVEAGVSFIAYPDYYSAGGAAAGFTEVRYDLKGLAEFRIFPSLAANLQLKYDLNDSQIVQAGAFEDDLSFNRFQAILGVRWFL